ncbi:hypothetical protein D3C80_1541290 [compost metagenome]
MRPNRKHSLSALLLMSQHRKNHVGISFSLHQIEKRMQSPIGIPQRKSRVICLLIRIRMIRKIQSAVRSRNILINCWPQTCVINSRVKIDQITFIEHFHFILVQFRLPQGFSCLPVSIKTPVRGFRHHIQ